MDTLLNYISECRRNKVGNETIRATLLSQGWPLEQVNAAFSEEAALQAKETAHDGGFLAERPEDATVDPGYLISFSWGYFGTSLVYAFVMRLSLWWYLAPIAYGILWWIVSFPVRIVLAFIPIFGPFIFAILNVFVPLALMYRLAHQVRQPAYQSRGWSSDYEFIQNQSAWDTYGKIVFTLILIGGLLFGGLAFTRDRDEKAKATALERCSKQAFSTVFGTTSTTRIDITESAKKMDQEKTTCMHTAGYPSYAASTKQP